MLEGIDLELSVLFLSLWVSEMLSSLDIFSRKQQNKCVLFDLGLLKVTCALCTLRHWAMFAGWIH